MKGKRVFLKIFPHFALKYFALFHPLSSQLPQDFPHLGKTPRLLF